MNNSKIDKTELEKFNATNKVELKTLDRVLFGPSGYHNPKAIEKIQAKPYSYFQSVKKFILTNWAFVTCAIIFIIMVLCSIIIPMGSYGHLIIDDAGSSMMQPEAPSSAHWFGLGQYGEDFFVECWAGLANTMLFALIIAVIEITIGLIVGFIWGYFRRTDNLFIQLTNVISALPSFVMTLVVIFSAGNAYWPLILAISIQTWVGFAIVVRTQVMFTKNTEFNIASSILGSSHTKIIFKNIAPCILPIIVQTIAFSVPNAISMDAFIHFLNLGFADGNKITSLGWIIKAVIGSDQTYWQEFPMLIAAPITMIIILGVIFFIIARILADALDPRNHR